MQIVIGGVFLLRQSDFDLPLAHGGRVKIVVILQTIFSNAFSTMNIVVFRFKFLLNMFPRARSTENHH